jgi:hypothetical protein
MTQAFNLAQLANNLNTSGQLDATDGLSGLVTNANLASSGTPSATTFLRGDRTWAIAGLQAATTGEAQAGTSDTVAITPLKMRQGFNASGSAPVYACRAWVNFDGTTATIRSSGNVSSITYLGTGYYRVNFSVVMPTNNYSVTGLSDLQIMQFPPTFVTNSSNFEVYTTTLSVFADATTVTFAVFC